jgi:hypothetical protein
MNSEKLERGDLIYTLFYVGLLMNQTGLKSVLRGKYLVTTD